MTNQNKRSQYLKQNLYLLSVLTLLSAVCIWINFNIQSINLELKNAEFENTQSLSLVDELRQSSDDLTTMARLYVTTGDDIYKEYFNEILAIRNGEKARPLDYQQVYWDFVLSSKKRPRPFEKKIALIDLIDSISSSNEAKNFFLKAKKSSDELARIEEEAFNAMQGRFKDSLGNYTINEIPNSQLAISLLYGKQYLDSKAVIMESIQDFSHYFNKYGQQIIIELKNKRDSFQYTLRGLLVVILSLLIIILANSVIKLFWKFDKDKKSPLGWKLVIKELSNSWLILFTSASFSILVLLFLSYTNRINFADNQKSLRASLTTVLESTESGVFNWINFVEKDVIQLVNSKELIALVKSPIVDDNKIQLTIRDALGHSSYEGFLLVSKEGTIISTNNSKWRNKSISSIANTVDYNFDLKGRIQTIFPDLNGLDELYNLSIKIVGNIGDDYQLFVLFNPQEKFSNILQLGRIGQSGESYAFNKKGLMISESRFTDQLIGQGILSKGQLSELNILLKDPVSESFTVMAEDALKGYSGIDVNGYNDYRGIKVLGAWSWSEKYQIGLTTEIDYNEAFSSYLRVKNISWYTGLFFLLILFSLTVIFIIDRIKLTRLRNTLEQSEKRFRSIASSASDAIISANKSGNIKSWNRAANAIFGYSEEEAIGKQMEIIIPYKHHEAHKKGMARVASGGEKHVIGKTVEFEGQAKDGRIIPIELSLSTWEGESGMEFSGIIRDITERKKIEEVLKKANKRMSEELNVAKEIQMSMLPLIFPAFPQRQEIDIYADLVPATEVGGDFYDFHFLDESHIYFVVGDVSGKGVPAALMMAVTKTLLKSRAGNDRSTASILTHVNNEIAQDNDTYMFITVFLAILNIRTGELIYSNAGHNPSFIIQENRKVTKLGDLHGPVIGAIEDMTYNETTVTISKKDIVFAYTDGVTEAQNTKEELYSDSRLLNLLSQKIYTGPKDLIEVVMDSVVQFQGNANQFDDITLLSLQYLGDKQNTEQNSFSISISNKLNQMPKVIEAFEQFGVKNDLSFGVIQKFNIVLDELLNNIISYGFKDNMNHEIEIEVELRKEKLIIILSDDGIPFNPFRNDPPDTKLSIEERNLGGLGIHIVKNLVDEYEYKRYTDKNIITLIKYSINN